jgi:hypothetical protein
VQRGSENLHAGNNAGPIGMVNEIAQPGHQPGPHRRGAPLAIFFQRRGDRLSPGDDPGGQSDCGGGIPLRAQVDIRGSKPGTVGIDGRFCSVPGERAYLVRNTTGAQPQAGGHREEWLLASFDRVHAGIGAQQPGGDGHRHVIEIFQGGQFGPKTAGTAAFGSPCLSR